MCLNLCPDSLEAFIAHRKSLTQSYKAMKADTFKISKAAADIIMASNLRAKKKSARGYFGLREKKVARKTKREAEMEEKCQVQASRIKALNDALQQAAEENQIKANHIRQLEERATEEESQAANAAPAGTPQQVDDFDLNEMMEDLDGIQAQQTTPQPEEKIDLSEAIAQSHQGHVQEDPAVFTV